MAWAGDLPESKRIYLANDDHTDYMWSMDEEGYRRAFLEMLDYYLAQIDATATNPSPYQSRWNCDGSFWLWIYEKNKKPEEFQRLIERVRDGHISAPMTVLPSCYGGQPAEAVLRGMYYAGALERRFDLRFSMAVAMENQTLPFGLGALWAGSGAKYSWRGICDCATVNHNAKDRLHEIYWWQGSDGSRVLMKWNSLLVNNAHMGGYAEARDPSAIVDFLDADPEFLRRYPYRVIGAFGKGWDDPKTFTDEFVKTARAKTTPTRQVIVSNEEDFFKDFEANYGAKLPVFAGSFGNEWDLYSASMPETTARVRRAVERLRNAEAMATLVSLHDSNFMEGRKEERALAWINLGRYWDHDWTADSQWVRREERAAFQARLAAQIEDYVEALERDAVSALGRLVRASPGAKRFFVFNALNWPRTDLADFLWADAAPVHVVDLVSGDAVPSQVVERNGQGFLRILARDVPSVGYKVYEIRTNAAAVLPPAATFHDGVLESQEYRVTVDGRGAITSLQDRRHENREFVRWINGRALNDLGPGEGRLEVENAGPVSVTVRATSSSPLLHTTRITLIRGMDRIEIQNEIAQNFTNVPTWSFAFNLDDPDLWHEEVGAVIRAKLLSEGGHYSPRNARYDWLTLNHFAAMSSASGDENGVTLSSADCAFMKFGNSTPAVLDTRSPQISVLAGGQVDGPELGIPRQGGEKVITQRFALQCGARFRAAQAMKFALAHQNPLSTGAILGDGVALPENSYSLVQMSNPDVLLWALKPADDGPAQDIIARFWNLSPEAAEISVKFCWAPRAAKQATHLETDLSSARLEAGVLRASFRSQQMLTFRIIR
jgi:alpha-mannosidase